jgi:hypothetical protein
MKLLRPEPIVTVLSRFAEAEVEAEAEVGEEGTCAAATARAVALLIRWVRAVDGGATSSGAVAALRRGPVTGTGAVCWDMLTPNCSADEEAVDAAAPRSRTFIEAKSSILLLEYNTPPHKKY